MEAVLFKADIVDNADNAVHSFRLARTDGGNNALLSSVLYCVCVREEERDAESGVHWLLVTLPPIPQTRKVLVWGRNSRHQHSSLLRLH